tara:strand:+ start:57 stop:257 length:201 start_codon:yes stop_codon:yes gene_type:complete
MTIEEKNELRMMLKTIGIGSAGHDDWDVEDWVSEIIYALNDPIAYVNDIKEAYYATEYSNENEVTE